MKQHAVILLPVHQPGEELLSLCAQLIACDSVVVVVDDGSDATYDSVFAALPPQVDLQRLPEKSGKGVAIKTGLSYIDQHYPSCLGVVTCEVSRRHTLANILAMCNALEECDTAILLGSRTFSKPLPRRSRLGNWLVRMAFSGACSIRIEDTQTDLRAYPQALLADLAQVGGERYEYATNVLLWANGEDIAIVEVPVPDVYTDTSIPKHYYPVRDSIRIFQRIFKFAIASFSGFCLDYVTVLCVRAWLAGLLGASLSLFVSVLSGRVLSGVVSFTLNRKMGFHVHDGLLRAAFKYFSILFLVMAVTYWLLFLTNIVCGIPLWLAKILCETTTFFLNYAMQNRLVFSSKKKKEGTAEE